MNTSQRIASLLIPALLLPACHRAVPPPPPTVNAGRQETRTYIREACVLSSETAPDQTQPFFGALLGIVVPILLERAIGGIASAIKKAGAAEDRKLVGTKSTYLFERNAKELTVRKEFGCVIVVHGIFDASDEAPGTETPLKVSDAGIFVGKDDEAKEKRKTRLRENGIPVVVWDLAYEAKIFQAADKTGFRYISQFLEVNRWKGTRRSTGRGLVVGITLSGAGEKEGSPELSTALLNLGEQEVGTVLGPDELAKYKSGWVGGIGISKASLRAFQVATDPESPKLFMPVNVTTSVVQTESGDAALRFIGEVLESAKGDLASAISDATLPEKVAEEEAAVEKALHEAKKGEENAYAAYLDVLTKTGATVAEREKIEFDKVRFERVYCRQLDLLRKLDSGAKDRIGSCGQ